ncbi:DUF5685 family protein [Peptostreptococcus canis]|uniref:Uncharacterized protein n=1 Tax=Peptostreptococcus canis TaxID=1159213 RepID=A0ABR6TL79_9FIRM|nr:DUF5685 family protein [Peptostreptococcus canis]MBC2576151.1 hypothetical protein [Peptostreptococcus canis]MBP1998316.1 hypothetical protein [Peptostreptococcus canis]
MFGYVRINKMDLTFREYENYKAYYCGLCKYLKRNHTEISRLTINYDITFLILILSSVYLPKSEIFEESCIVNPIKKKKHIINEITEYAASMNILLANFKIEDNIEDEGGFKYKFVKSVYHNSFKTAYKKFPDKNNIIKKYLKKLDSLERDNCRNIDLVSNTFGNLMAEIFNYKEDDYSDRLKEVGFNVGKYIYILDAYEDLEKDLEKGRYNPFTDYKNKKEELNKKVDRIISMTLSRLEEAIISLDLELNRSIIDNIIYSGIYLRYKGVLSGVYNKENQV